VNLVCADESTQPKYVVSGEVGKRFTRRHFVFPPAMRKDAQTNFVRDRQRIGFKNN